MPKLTERRAKNVKRAKQITKGELKTGSTIKDTAEVMNRSEDWVIKTKHEGKSRGV